MFECNYKFTIDDAVKCAKYVYKSQRRLREKFISWSVPILMLVAAGMLIFDIFMKRNYVFDIILISCLVVLWGLSLLMPIVVYNAQRKQYTEQNFGDMDSLYIKISNGSCEEAMMKNGEKVLSNTHNLKTLISYIEDEDNLILQYNTGEYTCIKKSKLKGDINALRAQLTKAMTIKTKK